MTALHYLTEYDRLKTFDTYKPIIMDMDERTLRVALLLILNGNTVEEAIDKAIFTERR